MFSIERFLTLAYCDLVTQTRDLASLLRDGIREMELAGLPVSDEARDLAVHGLRTDEPGLAVPLAMAVMRAYDVMWEHEQANPGTFELRLCDNCERRYSCTWGCQAYLACMEFGVESCLLHGAFLDDCPKCAGAKS